MYIMEICSEFDNIMNDEDFKDSFLYKKIKRVICVPVCKIRAVEEQNFHL